MKHFKLLTVIALLVMAIPCNAQLTINIRYSGENGSAREYVREMEESGIAGRIRAVEGCLRYDYFFPADDPEGLLLIDVSISRYGPKDSPTRLMLNSLLATAIWRHWMAAWPT